MPSGDKLVCRSLNLRIRRTPRCNDIVHRIAAEEEDASAMKRVARLSTLPAFTAALIFSTITLAADTTPVAVDEDISVEMDDLQFMDLLEQGRVIKLGDGQSVTLGYIRSCTREIISGGTITVGRDKSNVAGGAIERELVDCDGGDLQPSAGQLQTAGAIVFRKAPTKGGNKPKPQRILYGVSPLIRFLGDQTPTSVTILLERLDGKKDRYTIKITNSVIDLSDKNIMLEPGGLYVATAGDRKVVFRISPVASRTGGSVLGRLLAF